MKDRTIVEQVANDVTAQAHRLSGEDWTPRALLKKGADAQIGKGAVL
ncbi:MAG: PIN domain-containing protein, partial [Sulfitobacter sp. SK025]